MNWLLYHGFKRYGFNDLADTIKTQTIYLIEKYGMYEYFDPTPEDQNTINEKNKGLANSIIDGVTEIVNKYGKIIVIEDDLIVSKGFLKYMNQALIMYEDDSEVGCIHAWNYFFKNIEEYESTFFLKGADCWGWATWKSSWELFNPDANYLLNLIVSNKNIFISFSGTIAKFIKNKTHIPSIRGVRYHGPTKMSFLKLIRHSLLIISTFRKEVTIRLSILFLIYSTLIFYFFKNTFLLLLLPVAIANTLIIFTLFFLYEKNSS